MSPHKLLFILWGLFLSSTTFGQDWLAEIRQYQDSYKLHFILDNHSPLRAEDTGYIQFFAPDTNYRVRASFKPTPNSKEFDMPTYNGQIKKFRQYGTLTFQIQNTVCTLQVYQNPVLAKKKGTRDYLFLPFKDQTNYVSSYGGGRYIELRTGEIKKDSVWIDFNKSYNPYCAYGEGYSCPIPPTENHLPIAIPAGEMNFAKPGLSEDH